MMKWNALLPCAVIVLVCAYFVSSAEPETDHPAPTREDVTDGASARVGPGGAGAFADLSAPPFGTFYSIGGLTRAWNVGFDQRTLTIRTTESFGGNEVTYDRTFSTSFDIIELAARDATELYVLGRPDAGGSVIERWKIQDVEGSLTGEMAKSGTAIGTPAPPTSGSTTVVGGTYVALQNRGPAMPIRRTVVASESSVVIGSIGVDPEARFLLAATDSGELRQYEMVPGYPFHLIGGPALGPTVARARGTMLRYQHLMLGRVWILYWFDACYANGTKMNPVDYDILLMYDYDNDGVFDQYDVEPELGPTVGDIIYSSDLLSDFMHF